jgi:hypothetical protein
MSSLRYLHNKTFILNIVKQLSIKLKSFKLIEENFYIKYSCFSVCGKVQILLLLYVGRTGFYKFIAPNQQETSGYRLTCHAM